MTPFELLTFSEEIAELFNAGAIRHPVHLSGGNEEQLIEIFKEIAPDDWVTGSWRMHYQCLLKGVPVDKLKETILRGRSISLCFPEYRIVSSAIVGGSIPIALGIAWQIKRSGGNNRVHAFLGDMTRYTGIAHECLDYSLQHELPVRWIVERNGKSVCTPVKAVWPMGGWTADIFYDYELPWPHAGAGKRVEF